MKMGMVEIHVTIPPHRPSNSSAMQASSIFPFSTSPAPPAVTGAGAEAGVGAATGTGAGIKAEAGEGMANPMDTPSARGAVLGPTPSGQSRMGRAGSSCRMPQISSKV